MNITAQAYNTLSKRDANARFLKVIWRWLLVVAGSASAGTVIFGAVHTGSEKAITVATTGVAVTVLIAFFADIMGLLSGCHAYLQGHSDSLKPLTSGFWKAWGALTTIVIALYAFEASRSETPTKQGTEPWFIVYSNQPAGPVQRLSTIPALYLNNADHKTWDRGISFNKDELDVSVKAFERIFAAFKTCGSVPNKPPVHLQIVGFSSSKEFAGARNEHESNRLNAETADRRAWAAYCFARDQVNITLINKSDWPTSEWKCPNPTSQAPGVGRPITVDLVYWTQDDQGYGAMMERRPLQDRPVGISDEQKSDPEELDRRVDFNVIHAGACQKWPIGVAQTVADNKAQEHEPR
jgi:hypothetical protein